MKSFYTKLRIFLILVMCLAMMALFVACGGSGKCDHKYDDGKVVVSNCTEMLVVKTCENCGNNIIEKSDGQGHNYVNGESIISTCTETWTVKICEHCGENTVTKNQEDGHNVNVWDKDFTTHTSKCSDCSMTFDKSAHTFDKTNTCTVCQYVAQSTPGLVYTLSEDKTYYNVTGYDFLYETELYIAPYHNQLPVKGVSGFRSEKNQNKILPLKKIVISEGIERTENFYGCLYLNEIVLPKTLKYFGGVSYSAIKSITLPEGLEEIGDSAFQGTKIKNIIIPNNVKYIGAFAFLFSEVESIYLPASLQSVLDGGDGLQVFSIQPSLKSIIVDENNPYFCSVDGVLYNKDKTILYHYPAAKEYTSFVVPNSVKEIFPGAFWCLENLQNLTISKNVEYFNGIPENPVEGFWFEWVSTDYIDALKSKHIVPYIDVVAENEYYYSIDGVLYEKV